MVLSEKEWTDVVGVWTSRTCGDLVAKQKAITISGGTSVEAACEILLKNNILSAPVRHEATNELIGIFTYRTLLESLLVRFPRVKHPQTELVMSDMLHAVGPDVPVSSIVKPESMSRVKPDDTLVPAVDQFGKRVHRTAVVSGIDTFHGMLSQGMLLKFLLSKEAQVRDVMSRSLKDLGMVKGTVVAVPQNRLVIDAVELLIEKNISSIAITNNQKAIVGNLSLADIKYILRRRHYHMFWLDVERFLGHVKREEAFTADNMARDSYPVFTIHANKSLMNAAERMSALRTHRLWIIGNDFIPRGVISITDIMRLLTPPQM
eukprot:Plantae.Rhodophyta-Purpureofilum_apyrenoidigerum.ctg6663.p1 GENE.Plantae.Rhodophyta-Purpureofilum_apyrenoidigerum.ctg6663~~Plantae.Rhodophyta-Purpureofilum_apyrenoidigerum.ctg6663.p1  ORF type:complete len:319 (-),score=46.53 Plantae.Rhodophyta-Purpureofilum_apyrenoidigerum.ctg6663:64-1020(-)